MASGEQSNVHDVEQLDEMFLFITSECPFGQDVGKLASCIDILKKKGVEIKVNLAK